MRQELQDKFAVDLDEMILKMNSSYRVENEADYEMVLGGLQSEILKQTSICMNYSNAQEWIDSKLIQMAKRILF